MSIATGSDLSAETFNDFVQRLRHDVRGKGVDDHCTADAIFIVQARRIIFGIGRDYTDKVAVGVDESMYFSPQEYWDSVGLIRRTRLDRMADAEHEEPFLRLEDYEQWDLIGALDDHTVAGWDERWEYVNSHFTKDAAEAFIKRKKHDYPDGLRVYVEAQVHCWEFNSIIKGLLDGRIVFSEQANFKEG